MTAPAEPGGSTQPPVAGSVSLVGPGNSLRRLLGLWRPADQSRLRSRLLAAMSLCCTAFLVLCVALKLYMDPPEALEQITLCCLAISTCAGFFFKAALFVAQGDTLRQTVRLLEDMREQFGSGDYNQQSRRRYQTLSNNIYYYCQLVAVPAVIGWVLCPLLSQTVSKTDQGQQDTKWELPAPAWLPVDVHESPTYEIMYVVQSICVLAAIEVCLSIDIFFFHVMLMIAAELKVLNSNLHAMGDTNLQPTRNEEDGFIPGYKINDRSLALLNSGQSLGEQISTENAEHKWHHQQLVKNVLHHQAILRATSLLQSAMTVSTFSLLFVNMANLCSSLFVAGVLLQKEGHIGKALNALFSIPALLYETFNYCIYGHIMTDQSEKLVYSAFSCGWVNRDARFKRSTLIFMLATMRPTVITVGKTCKLSKQMLIQVLNGTYGLLNMIYHVHKNK